MLGTDRNEKRVETQFPAGRYLVIVAISFGLISANVAHASFLNDVGKFIMKVITKGDNNDDDSPAPPKEGKSEARET